MRRQNAPLMGVVADDVTGSNDIGIMFAKAGLLTHVYSIESTAACTRPAPPDICILNTGSRLDPAAVAYAKAYAAARALKSSGCERFYKKTCSAFRGNIGPELDAVLDALGLEFAVVVLGFPKNGRTTLDGTHYVRGVRLEDSEFRSDPVHPMDRSDLVGILQRQTERRVGLLTWRAVDRGADALRREIDAMRSRCAYLILDVRDQRDLSIIAAAVKDEPVLCGSSGLAEELPAAWGVVSSAPVDEPLPAGQSGILCIAGSLMPQTAAQIEAMRESGADVFALDSARVVSAEGARAERARLVPALVERLRGGSDAVLHSGGRPEQVGAANAAGDALGLSRGETSRRVSAALAAIGAEAARAAGLTRLIVAGGETSDAVCAELGVNGLRVGQEIEPGVPSCTSLTDPPLALVLKSGSFGSREFLVKAAGHLRSSGERRSVIIPPGIDR